MVTREGVMPAWLRFGLYLIIGFVLVGILIFFKGVIGQQRQAKVPGIRAATAGSPSVLYFHRHGCPHCLLANPVMAELQDRYQGVGWVTVQITPDLPADVMSLYMSWLEHLNMNEIITPLIVIGPQSNNPVIYPGYGGQLSDREKVENDLRTRLGLEPVDLDKEAVDFPVFGLVILTDLIPEKALLLLGLLAGFHPLGLLLYLYFLMKPRRPAVSALGLGAIVVAATILIEVASSVWGLPQLSDSVWPVVLRIVLAILALIVAFICMRHFLLVSPATLGDEPLPALAIGSKWLLRSGGVVVFGLVIDTFMTTWILGSWQAIHAVEAPVTVWALYSAVVPSIVVLAAAGYLRFGEFSPRALRVAALFCCFLFTQIGCFLLFAHQFSGYGSPWLG